MLDKEKYINTILEEIFQLNDPVVDKTRGEELSYLITRFINGDTPQKHLVINLGGIAVAYILTNYRIIKIDIDNKKVQSNSFVLSDIIKIETEKFAKENRIETQVFLLNSIIGLNYPVDDKKATEFFQAIDDMRVKRN